MIVYFHGSKEYVLYGGKLIKPYTPIICIIEHIRAHLLLTHIISEMMYDVTILYFKCKIHHNANYFYPQLMYGWLYDGIIYVYTPFKASFHIIIKWKGYIYSLLFDVYVKKAIFVMKDMLRLQISLLECRCKLMIDRTYYNY